MGLSLRTKWTALLLFTGALPLALFSYRSLEIQRQGLSDAERQLEVSVVDHAALILDDAGEEAVQAAHRVGRLLTEDTITDEDARLTLARETVGRAEIIAVVAIYDAEGALIDGIAREGAGAPPPLPPALGAEQIGDARPRWLPMEHAATGVVVRYIEPVDRGGERRAWVMAVVDVRVLGSRLEGLSRDRFEGRSDGVLLVDGGLRVAAGGGTGELAVGQSLAGRDLFAKGNMPSDLFARDFAMSTEFTAPNGEAMSGSLRVFPDRRWAVVVRRGRGAAYAQLAQARRTLAISAAGLALLAIALGAWLGRRTTRPIERLVELTEAYGGRRFDVRSPVKSGDELEVLGGSLEKMADGLLASEKEIARRATIAANLSRYLPSEVASSIAEGKATLALGGERRAITVLFADVVSFTTFAEGAPPERVVAFLNELFSVLTEVVFRHGGTVDKFVGDCIMAFFGAPTAVADHARRALAAAEDMHRFVEANAPAWKEKYAVDVRLGIGVNSGDALVGNLGSETRMDYTAIGDVVNVAARLERLAQPGQTLITEEVANAAGDAFDVHALGPHPLRGKRQSVQIFELR